MVGSTKPIFALGNFCGNYTNQQQNFITVEGFVKDANPSKQTCNVKLKTSTGKQAFYCVLYSWMHVQTPFTVTVVNLSIFFRLCKFHCHSFGFVSRSTNIENTLEISTNTNLFTRLQGMAVRIVEFSMEGSKIS